MTKSEKMFALVDHWKAGNLTQKQFCQEHGIKVGTLAYWVAKRKQGHDPASGEVFVFINRRLAQSRPTGSDGLLTAGQLQDPSGESPQVVAVCTGKHHEYKVQR